MAFLDLEMNRGPCLSRISLGTSFSEKSFMGITLVAEAAESGTGTRHVVDPATSSWTEEPALHRRRRSTGYAWPCRGVGASFFLDLCYQRSWFSALFCAPGLRPCRGGSSGTEPGFHALRVAMHRETRRSTRDGTTGFRGGVTTVGRDAAGSTGREPRGNGDQAGLPGSRSPGERRWQSPPAVPPGEISPDRCLPENARILTCRVTRGDEILQIFSLRPNPSAVATVLVSLL